MARVPYPIAPDAPIVQPEPSARVYTPRFDVQTTPAMFGGAVGAAVEHFGLDLDKVGDESVQTALKIKEMQNQASARDKVTNWQNDRAQARAQYFQTQGENAVKGLPGFTQSTVDSYNNMLSQTGSLQERNLAAQEGAFWVRQEIARASDHAYEEQKKWTTQTRNSQQTTTLAGIAQDPMDEKTFQTARTRLGQIEDDKSKDIGASPETTQANKLQQYSTAWKERIKAAARMGGDGSLKAKQWFEQASKDGELKLNDAVEAAAYVQDGLNRNGAIQAYHNVVSGRDLADQYVSPGLARVGFGTEESGNRYNLIGVNTIYGHALGRYQVMEAFLADFLKEAGMRPMTRDEFLADPKAQDQLFDTLIDKYEREGHGYGAAINKWFTGSFTPKPTRADILGTTAANYQRNVLTFTAQALARVGSQLPQDEIVKRTVDNIKRAGGDQDAQDHAEMYARKQFIMNKQIQADDDYTGMQKITAAFLKNNPDGTIPSSWQELEKIDGLIPEYQKRMSPEALKKVQKAFDDAGRYGYQMTPQAWNTYYRVRGELVSDDPDKIQAGLHEFLPGLRIDNPHMQELNTLQQRVKNQTLKLPNLSRAMETMQAAYGSAVPPKGTDDYDIFRGILEDQLSAHRQRTGKDATDDEIKAIGARLLGTVSGTGWFGTEQGDINFFNKPPPDDFKDQFYNSAAFKASGLREGDPAADFLLRRFYLDQTLEQSPTRQQTSPAVTPTSTPSPRPGPTNMTIINKTTGPMDVQGEKGDRERSP